MCGCSSGEGGWAEGGLLPSVHEMKEDVRLQHR